jgi:hypothetical protein
MGKTWRWCVKSLSARIKNGGICCSRDEKKQKKPLTGTQPIHVRHENTVVALMWPSPVPNTETASSARHEMAMRAKPPQDAERLKALVLDQLNGGCGAEELYQAAVWLTSWLEGFVSVSCTPLSGVTEWRKCAVVEYGAVCFFKGTQVPMTFLFQELRDHKYIEEFLQKHPSVTRKQVDAVIDHIALTIN